jgi:hypothetical protein
MAIADTGGGEFDVDAPAYAPDLNPEKVCNAMVNADMLNATPTDVQDLRRMARRSFHRLQH